MRCSLTEAVAVWAALSALALGTSRDEHRVRSANS